MTNRSEKFTLCHDGTVWRCRLRGGSGVVFADTEAIALSRAESWTFAHKKERKNNQSGVHSYDASR